MAISRALLIPLYTFLAVGFLLGCQTLGVLNSLIEPPKVDVQSVNVSDVGLKGIALEVNLKVDNPNSTPLTIDKIIYDLSIGDSSLLKGVFDKKIELKSKDISFVTIPIQVDYESAKEAIGNYLFKSVKEYKLKGSLSSGAITVPIEDSGKIKVN